MSPTMLTRPLTRLTVLTMLVLTAPTLAMAQHACESSRPVSCPEGQSLDADTQTCTPLPTS
ncbi:hypothetical protein C4N9_10855 [Pararhodobacter marinus]|uniref:Adenylosuccinate lyase n=1 Tax=Pararhodobacter marinus TaxID=2184063 RepID=A0A2U2C9F3_9RHOB|nr:hypothetical protein C4N9_10855 [Pararhodobacter marinus]